MINGELVVDNFAGGGGASTGIEMATGYSVDIAINHDPEAIRICYGMYESTYYILDVLYTKEPMEVTEPATAQMLTNNNVGNALIESNNGGRGFSRNVIRELKSLGNTHTKIQWFFQSKNKTSRILSNSTGVMQNVLFPVNWEDRWPDFAEAIRKYQKEGKNAHDDAPDALTGVYENDKPKGTWLV